MERNGKMLSRLNGDLRSWGEGVDLQWIYLRVWTTDICHCSYLLVCIYLLCTKTSTEIFAIHLGVNDDKTISIVCSLYPTLYNLLTCITQCIYWTNILIDYPLYWKPLSSIMFRKMSSLVHYITIFSNIVFLQVI